MFGRKKKTISNLTAPADICGPPISLPHMGGNVVRQILSLDIKPPKRDHIDVSGKKRVLFVGQQEALDTAVVHYRMWIPAKYSGMCGHMQVRFCNALTDDNTEWADIIVLSRCESSYALALVVKAQQLGVKVVYDTDDNLTQIPNANPAKRGIITEGGKSYKEWMHLIIRQADVLTVSTPELAAQYRNYNPNCHVVKNYLDFQNPAFDTRPHPDPKWITIGYAGGKTHTYDVAEISEVMRHITGKYRNVRFAMCGAPEWRSMFFEGIPDGQYVQVPYVPLVDFPKVYNSFDISLAPLAPTEFNRCKTPLKLLDAGAMGVPSVASDIAPYRRFAEEGQIRSSVTGYNLPVTLLARNYREWVSALEELIEHSDYRRSIGQACKKYVRSEFDAATHSDVWWIAYQTAFEED